MCAKIGALFELDGMEDRHHILHRERSGALQMALRAFRDTGVETPPN